MIFTRLALGCAVAAALAACGGGGSSSVAVPPVPTPVVPVARTLDGVAAKGLIKNGIVKVFSYSATGVKATDPLVTSRTSAVDGSYSVNLGSNIGLFTVEVSSDASTTMADEVSGSDIPMPITMTMRTLVQLDSAAATNVKGHVTPFTEMLVMVAGKATGGLTAANVATAQNGVTTMLGFNPLLTKPVMVNSAAAAAVTDLSEKLQSIALAALSKIANDSSNGLGCSGSVSAKVACVVGATTGAVELKNGNLSMPLAVQVAVRDAAEKVTANKALNKTTLTTLNGAATFAQATIAVGAAVVNPIVATKSMFASLRNNAHAWQSSLQPGASANPLDTLGADFSKAIAPLDQSLMNWVEVSRQGMRLYKTFVDANSTGPTFADVMGPNGAPIGSCSLLGKPVKSIYCATNEELSFATQTTLARAAFTDARHILHPATSLTGKMIMHDITLTPVVASTTSFTYQADSNAMPVYFNRDTFGQIADLNYEADRNLLLSNPVTGSIAFVLDGGITNSLTLNGDMPARFDDKAAYLSDKSSIKLSYQRTPETSASSTKYDVSGDISAYKKDASGVSVKTGTIAIAAGSYLRTGPDSTGNVNLNNLTELNLNVSVTGIDSKIAGMLAMKDFVSDHSGHDRIPTDIKFVGTLSNGSAEFFSGTLTAKVTDFAKFDANAIESDSNFIKLSGSFVGILRLAGRPDVRLSLSGTQLTSSAGAFSGQYEDGTNTLLISDSGATPKIINIASADGVSFQFVEEVNLSDVFKNGSKVAVFDRHTGIITYTDGSFESLK